jgi:hypothetical protein
MANKVLMATAGGEQHGLINTLTNNVAFDDFKSFTPEYRTQLQKEKKEDSRVVKVEYLNSRGRHERLTKPYCKYAGDPIHVYHLIPGKTYELPLGFVKEVNESQDKLVKRAGLLEVDGKELKRDGSPLDQDEKGDWVHKLVAASF